MRCALGGGVIVSPEIAASLHAVGRWGQYARLFVSGFVIVAMTSWNVRHIGALQYGPAAGVAFGISFVWWGNSRGAAHSGLRFAREVYAAGASCGTVFGMWLGR